MDFRPRAIRVTQGLETTIVVVLLLLLAVVLTAGTIQLVITVFTDTADHWRSVHTIDELAELRPVFSGFLLILIGLELMKTIAMYLSQHSVHVEIVLTVAMIAVARHAIDIDFGAASAGQLLGTAGLLVSLGIAHYLYRRSPEQAADTRERH